jgi:hypothetical protein
MALINSNLLWTHRDDGPRLLFLTAAAAMQHQSNIKGNFPI